MPNGITGGKRIEMSELTESSVLLSECDEDTQREYLISLAHMYKDAKVGDGKFKEICQGRSEGPAARNELFSTCGEWAMFLLERMGYRGPVLNRNLFDAEGRKTRTWVQGKNIEYIFTRGRREGLFVEYLLSKQKGKRPSPGDIAYIAVQGRPVTEHVFMFEGFDANPGSKYELWTSVDGGQGGNRNQHIAECHRVFDQASGKVFGVGRSASGELEPRGEGREVVGWLNVALLELVAEANLHLPTA